MKQVKKSNDNRLLAGVCGGIAEYFTSTQLSRGLLLFSLAL